LIVGTMLFAINQLDVVVAGHAMTTTWIKIAVTYLVPFCVSNIGLLIGCRQHPGPDHAGPAVGQDQSPRKTEGLNASAVSVLSLVDLPLPAPDRISRAKG
jgi:hypothetical protein